MRTVKSSWQTESDRLVCRWSEAIENQPRYNPPWTRGSFETGSHSEAASPLVLALDFTRLSPLAGKDWFERALAGFLTRPACPR